MHPNDDLLEQYLAQEKQHGFQWGGRNGDCYLFVAGWVEQIGWPAAAADWRGRYSSEAEARALLVRRGGPVSIWTEKLGNPRCGSSSIRGDVGLLEYDGWHLGMICTGRMWAFRHGKRGINLIRVTPDFVWDTRFDPA